MLKFAVLLSLFVGNPPVSGGFLPQRDSNADHWCLLLSVWTNCWTLDWLTIPDVMTVIWHCRNWTWKRGKMSVSNGLNCPKRGWVDIADAVDVTSRMASQVMHDGLSDTCTYISTYENLCNTVNILSLLSCTTYDESTSVWMIHW